MPLLSPLALSFYSSPFYFRISRVGTGVVLRYSSCTFLVRTFSRGIPYNPEGTIQDFSCSPRHIGLGKLLQEKDKAIYGRTPRESSYSTREHAMYSPFGEEMRQEDRNEKRFNGPLVTTREGTRAMLAEGVGRTFFEGEGAWRKGEMNGSSLKHEEKTRGFSSPEMQDFRSGDEEYHFDRPPPSVGVTNKEDYMSRSSPQSMQQFYAEVSMSAAGDTYRQDCRTDPRYAHLPPHVRSAQQSVLDMQHDSFGESIRGMVPPPPPRPSYSTLEEEEELRAYRPPRVSVPAGWGVAVGAFLVLFTVMGLYGK